MMPLQGNKLMDKILGIIFCVLFAGIALTGCRQNTHGSNIDTSSLEAVIDNSLIAFDSSQHVVHLSNAQVHSAPLYNSFGEYNNSLLTDPNVALIVGEVAGPSINRIIWPAIHLRNETHTIAGFNHVITPVLIHHIVHNGENIGTLQVGEIIDVRENYFYVTEETSEYQYTDVSLGDVFTNRGAWPMEIGNRYFIAVYLGNTSPDNPARYNREHVFSALGRGQIYPLTPIMPTSTTPGAPDHFLAWHQEAIAIYGDLYHLPPPPPAPLPAAISPAEVSIVTQGFRDANIYDSSGNLLIRDGRNIYRRLSDGSGGIELVGQRIPISQAMRRFHYVLELDEYVFRNPIFTQGIDTEITITTSYDWMLDSLVRFEDFAGSNHLELTVSPAVANLTNTLTRSVIEPTEIASPARLRELNESSGRGGR